MLAAVPASATQPETYIERIHSDSILATLRIDNGTSSISFKAFQHEQVDRVFFPPRDASSEQIDGYARQILRLAAQRIIYAGMAVKEKLAERLEVTRAIDKKLHEILLQKLRDRADSLVKEPSEEAILAYYQANQEDFRKPETYKIQTVNSYCPSPQDAKAMQIAHEHIQKAWSEIQSGSDFIKIAIKYSNSPLPYRGETIIFSAGELYPAIEKTAHQLKNGEISPPFQTRMGYMIIRRTAYTPALTESLTEASPRIKSFLANQARESHWRSFKRRNLIAMNPRIHESILFDGAPKAEDQVLEFKGDRLTWGELQEFAEKQNESIDGLSSDERKKRINGWIEKALLCRFAEECLAENDGLQNELRQVRQDLLFREMQRELLENIRKNIQISDGLASDYVEKNPGYFRSEKQTRICLLNIPYSTEDSAPAVRSNRQKAEALRKAYEAREKLLMNQDASLISAEYCGKDWKYDLDIAPQGPRGRLVDMSVEQLQVGEISEPVEHVSGYYLIRLLDVQESAPMPPDAAKEKAIKLLTGIQAREILDKDLDGILASCGYRIHAENFPLLIDKIKG